MHCGLFGIRELIPTIEYTLWFVWDQRVDSHHRVCIVVFIAILVAQVSG